MEEDRDYIIVLNSNGEKTQAELVCNFELKNLGKYVIYKIDNEYYGAKYHIDNDITSLITDLTEEEKSAMNEIFKNLGVE